jgi:DNA-binding NtrC family response regulator
VPPLRERPDDIDMLARHFARALAHRTGREVELGDDAVARLRELHWEGNVRQLRHTVERSCYLAAPGRIGRRDLVLDEEPSPASATQERWFVLPLKDALARNGDAFARRYCEHLLRTCNGDLDEAARRAEYSRKGLRELLRRVGLLGDDVATDERGSQH